MKKRVVTIVCLIALAVVFICSNALAVSSMDLRALEASLENGFSAPKDVQTMMKNAWANGYDHCRIAPSEDGKSFVIEVAVRGLSTALRTLIRSDAEEDAVLLMQAREILLNHCQDLCDKLEQEGWSNLHFSFVLMDDDKFLENEYASHAVIASIAVANSRPVHVESQIEAWDTPVLTMQTFSTVVSQTADETTIVIREPTYILNINSKKFHHPTCDSVGKTKEQNRKEFFGERDELISTGYTPCGSCHP